MKTELSKDDVFNLLDSLNADDGCFVAGSAAIAPAHAEDIDVWVMPNSRVQKVDFSKGLFKPFEFITDPKTAEDYAAMELQPTLPIPFEKILEANIPGSEYWSPMKVQLIFLSPWWGGKSGFDVLKRFDCSCHAWAVTRGGYRISHPQATIPGDPIKLIMSNSKSKQRASDFTARYDKLKSEGNLKVWMPGC